MSQETDTTPPTSNFESRAADYPGARAPEREFFVDAGGVEIRCIEWGRESDPLLLLAHGGADFAQTFDVLGPRLASAGWRVASWDHRGHGGSGRAALYSWDADVRDALAVLDHYGREAIPVVGHSKGGGLFSFLCSALPERFTHFVNIDGIPGVDRRHGKELTLEERVAGRDRLWKRWLEGRRRSAGHRRRPGSLAELAERRAAMNPRLSEEWLRYLVTVGATQSEDGWRWNLDPAIRMGDAGPWRPSWGLRGLAEIEVPMLVLLGRIQEPMGWGTTPEEVKPYLPASVQLQAYEDSGHFVHIEHPERAAKAILEFLS
ncbi:MAG: alpha/beta hydrolase [Acidobacteriota bacterium]